MNKYVFSIKLFLSHILDLSKGIMNCIFIYHLVKMYKMSYACHIWERIWEKGPIGNFFTNSIPEKLPF